MNKVEIIIPTIGAIKKTSHPYTCFESLRHVPFHYKLHVIQGGSSWAEGINIGISQTDPESDIIIMDDDVFLKNDTFANLDKYYDQADIFGFKLTYPDLRIQHAGGIYDGVVGHIGWGEKDNGQCDTPLYVCHVTTSLTYIKSHVVKKLGGMHVLPGVQFEDVDWSFRALKAGFKIMYLPGWAVHIESATKKFMLGFDAKMQEAQREIHKRHLSDDVFTDSLKKYPKAVG